MKWRRIEKVEGAAPVVGTYKDWKEQLAREGGSQCVYCCIHESRFGGTRNFHVEHHRPQSKFPHLRDEYGNLFYACGVCNVFKSNDWPGDHTLGDYTKHCYPSPSDVDYGDFLKVENPTGYVTSDSATGRYVIERLYLNRPHLVGLRAVHALYERIRAVQNTLIELLRDGVVAADAKDEIINVLTRQIQFLEKQATARPYAGDQIKRA